MKPIALNELPPRVRQLHDEALLLDTHAHFLLNGHYLKKNFTNRYQPPFFWNPLRNMIDLPRLEQGGVNAVAFTVYVPPILEPRGHFFKATLAQLDTMRNIVTSCDGRARLTLDPRAIRKAHQDRVLAVIPMVEGGRAVEKDPANVGRLYDEGVRLLTITHFITNKLADTATFLALHNGLSTLGRLVIREMNRLGMVIDVAHCSDKAFKDVISESRAPVVVTHAGVRHFKNSQRNLSDEQIKAIAASGGVMGAIILPWYLKPYGLWIGLEHYIDTMAYIADLVGPEHVCLGSDMDGWTWAPRGFSDATTWPRITHLLLEKGFSETEVKGILGENYLRVWSEVERAAD